MAARACHFSRAVGRGATMGRIDADRCRSMYAAALALRSGERVGQFDLASHRFRMVRAERMRELHMDQLSSLSRGTFENRDFDGVSAIVACMGPITLLRLK